MNDAAPAGGVMIAELLSFLIFPPLAITAMEVLLFLATDGAVGR